MGLICDIVEYAHMNNMIESDVVAKLLGYNVGYTEELYPEVAIRIVDNMSIAYESTSNTEVKIIKDITNCIGGLPLKINFTMNDYSSYIPYSNVSAIMHFELNGTILIFINLPFDDIYYWELISNALHNEIDHLPVDIIIADWESLLQYYNRVKGNGEFGYRLRTRTR